MVLNLECLARLCSIRSFALAITFAGVIAGGCAGPPVTPPSPAAKEPPKPEDQQQAWNPNVVVEPGGRIFITYYGGRGESQHRFLFTRSLDGGLTWLPEPVQLDSPPAPRTRFGFHRLETNGDGQISVTWSIERKEETYWRVREVRHRQSSDSGATWTGEVLRWELLQQSNYPTPRRARDGAVHLLWTEGTIPQILPRFIRTTGSGMAWAPTPLTLPGVAVAAGQTLDGPKNRREAHWPFLAIDPRGPVNAVWQEASGHGTDILFNRSQDGGNTWLGSSLRLNTPSGKTGYTSRMPVAAIDGAGGIYVVWEDFRHNTTDLYFNRSLDGGATWLDKDLWLTAVRPSQAAATFPLLSTDRSGRLYLLWGDIRQAPNTLYFTRSLDRGATWLLEPIRLDRHAPNAITYAHRLAHDDAGHVYAAWWEGTSDKGSVRFRRSDDSGATWVEKDQILDTGQGTEGPRFPWLSADEKGGVYVVWSSDRNGRYQLYLNRSTDHGKTWLPEDVQITGPPGKKTRGS